MKDWNNKKIAILGFGIEGRSSARYLSEQGANLTICDAKPLSELEENYKKAVEELGAEYQGAEEYLDHLADFAVVVRSPGISRFTKELVAAEENGVKITSHTQIFLDACPARVIGVTGTKGKGTTSTLIYEMLKITGKELSSVIEGVFLGGNIGMPPLDFLAEVTEKSVVVLELSSFQLEDLTTSPHIAVMLMIVPEHLNRHADMEEYVSAKRNILLFQTPEDFAVINRDYIPSNESDIHTDGKVFYVTRERTTTEQGCFVRDNAIWISMQGAEWKIIECDEVALPGKHNIENACAAAMAATLAGASKQDIASVLRSFSGLPHRLELVKEVQGVKYYDDSFSTTPETAIAAIEAFIEPEILILGGSSKNSDFAELGKLIAKKSNIKAIIGIGEEWPRIKQAIESHYSSSGAKGEVEKFEEDSSRRASLARTIKPLIIEGARDIETIVAAAAKIATSGDVVILSPACASFDMFKNYKERGDQFKKEVNLL